MAGYDFLLKRIILDPENKKRIIIENIRGQQFKVFFRGYEQGVHLTKISKVPKSNDEKPEAPDFEVGEGFSINLRNSQGRVNGKSFYLTFYSDEDEKMVERLIEKLMTR